MNKNPNFGHKFKLWSKIQIFYQKSRCIQIFPTEYPTTDKMTHKYVYVNIRQFRYFRIFLIKYFWRGGGKLYLTLLGNSVTQISVLSFLVMYIVTRGLKYRNVNPQVPAVTNICRQRQYLLVIFQLILYSREQTAAHVRVKFH